MTQYVAAAKARYHGEAAFAQSEFDSITENMPTGNVKALRKVIQLHGEAYAARQSVNDEQIEYQQQAWNQFKQVEIGYQNSVREFACERAALASQKVSLEAAINVRDQEKQIILRMLSGIAERKLEDRYRVTL